MNLFYCATLPDVGTFALDDEEARHLAVLRLSAGDRVWVTDGRGTLAECEIAGPGKKMFLEVVSITRQNETGPHLTLAVAPTKNQDRLEWFVEKAIEVGIHEIILFISDHSEKPRVNLNRLHRLAVAAMKQSGRCHLPAMSEPVPFDQMIEGVAAGHTFLAHCRTDMPRTLLKDALAVGSAAFICIGPEGDFSRREIELATAHGFTGVSLGDARLRTETAALVSVITFGVKNL